LRNATGKLRDAGDQSGEDFAQTGGQNEGRQIGLAGTDHHAATGGVPDAASQVAAEAVGTPAGLLSSSPGALSFSDALRTDPQRPRQGRLFNRTLCHGKKATAENVRRE
jgi:hypothetical protein